MPLRHLASIIAAASAFGLSALYGCAGTGGRSIDAPPLPVPATAEAAPSPSAPEHFHRRFDDVETWAKKFDDPKRDAWQRPDETVALLISC